MLSSSPGYTVHFALSGERSCPQLRFLYTSISIIRIIPHQHDQRHLPGDSKFLPSWQSTPVITSESPYIPVSVLCLPTLVLVWHFGSWAASSQWVALDPSSWFSCGQICCSYLLCCIYPPTLAMAGKLGGQWFVWQFSTGAPFPIVRAVITSMHVVYSWSDMNMLAHMHFGRHADRLLWSASRTAGNATVTLEEDTATASGTSHI